MKQDPKETWKKIWPILNKHYKREETFLNYRNTWELLIAVILSAQMTDDGVNAISDALFERFPDAKSMASADLFEIAEYVKKINFYNAKSRYIQKTAQMIVNQFDGKVPNNVDDLIKLSGVGRKTAVAVLANGFGKYVGIAVDTHVIRFAKRFALSRHIDASKIEQDLLQIIPKKDWNSASYAIKEYGRREGRARNWKSEEDPVYQKFRR